MVDELSEPREATRLDSNVAELMVTLQSTLWYPNVVQEYMTGVVRVAWYSQIV